MSDHTNLRETLLREYINQVESNNCKTRTVAEAEARLREIFKENEVCILQVFHSEMQDENWKYARALSKYLIKRVQEIARDEGRMVELQSRNPPANVPLVMTTQHTTEHFFLISFLQRTDSAEPGRQNPADKSITFEFPSFRPYLHEFNDIMSLGDWQEPSFLITEDIDKYYLAIGHDIRDCLLRLAADYLERLPQSVNPDSRRRSDSSKPCTIM